MYVYQYRKCRTEIPPSISYPSDTLAEQLTIFEPYNPLIHEFSVVHQCWSTNFETSRMWKIRSGQGLHPIKKGQLQFLLSASNTSSCETRTHARATLAATVKLYWVRIFSPSSIILFFPFCRQQILPYFLWQNIVELSLSQLAAKLGYQRVLRFAGVFICTYREKWTRLIWPRCTTECIGQNEESLHSSTCKYSTLGNGC